MLRSFFRFVQFDRFCTRKWQILFCLTIAVGVLRIGLSEIFDVYSRSRSGIEAKPTLQFSELMLDQWDKYKRYLRLQNTLLTSTKETAVALETKRTFEEIIRSGRGLQSYKTDKGEDAWIENGIVHLPSGAKNSSAYPPEYVWYIPFDEDMFFEGKTPDARYKTERKIILWDIAPSYVSPKPDLQPMETCPEFPCVITTNTSLYRDKSSALIFAANKVYVEKPPERTSPDQVFVLHNHEPPHFFDFSKVGNPNWRSVFNYSLTYRMDSDLAMPYAIVRKRPGTMLQSKDYHGIFANKTGMVVWAVSHCKTVGKRERYVRRLRKHLKIDVIGLCGKNNCPRSKRDFCNDQMAKKYKFYLAFENALCLDYITEKLFTYLRKDIVIVARGSDEYYKHLPPEIFINTNDFPSPEALAERLRYLANHEADYLNILREKDKYIVMLEDHGILHPNGEVTHNDFFCDNIPLCLLCQWVWNVDKHRKTIRDAYEWFMEGECRAPKDLIG